MTFSFIHGPLGLLTLTGLALWPAGCTSISVAPSCPTELRVGESGPVAAHEQDPGAIPRYFWEVIPSTAGRFDTPTAKDTRFQALQEADAVLRLTASDGLYQVVAECQTRIRGVVEVAVALAAQPAQPRAGEPVTLTCSSVGMTDAVTRTIEQVIDPPPPQILELRSSGVGVVGFEASRAGTYVFRCTGINAQGASSEPVTLSLVLGAASGNGNGNANINANGNGNANGNDNTDSAANDNGVIEDDSNANDNESDREPK